MKDHLAEDYVHPNYDELEECSETTGEEEQFNHMVEEDKGIEEEVRPKRQRRKTEFFCEPIRWDSIK